MDIPSINENVVRLLVHWIYSQKVDLEQLRSNKEDEFYFANMYRALVKLYVLGDKLLIPLLQDATIEAMEEFNQKFNILPTHIIRYIYENTAPISTLRRFLVRRSASRRWATNDNLMAEQATPEFLVDVVHALHEIMTKSTRDKLRPSSDMSIFKIAKDEGTL